MFEALKEFIMEKRIDRLQRKAEHYRYKLLMSYGDDTCTMYDLGVFLDEYEICKSAEARDYLTFWQRMLAITVLVLVELALSILVTGLVLTMMLIDPIWVLLGAAFFVATPLDIWMIFKLEDSIGECVYNHRVKRMKAKLATQPVA